MHRVCNKPIIDKCILSFSHNRFRTRAEADELSLKKARSEIASGKRGVSHLILRAEDDETDRLKFLFLIHGIPVMCYALANVLRSSIQQVVVVGSPEVETVLEAYLKTVGDLGKSVEFIPENLSNLSLISTMNLGRQILKPEKNELVLFQPGDLPFMFDLEKVLLDKKIETHSLILWLNARSRMFPDCDLDRDSEFVARNYHYRTIDPSANELLDVKEPNVYPINFSAVEPDLIELLHKTRKNGKIFIAGINKALKHPKRFLRLLPVLTHQVLNFKSAVGSFREQDTYQFGMHQDKFDHAASILLNTAVTSTVHDDPSFVADVDALEDWEDYEALTDHAFRQNGDDGLSSIHPHATDLLNFRKNAMPGLEQTIPMYTDFKGYMNNLYLSLEMGYVPYDSFGDYSPSPAMGKRTRVAFRWYNERIRLAPQCT